MTYNLEHLTQARKTMLLAEIAGLLHNLGKLDPNFLASYMEDQDRAEKEIIAHIADIPAYRFQRFAAPNPALLAKGRDVITGSRWESRAKLANALQKGLDEPHAHNLDQDWDTIKSEYPATAAVIEAAWNFSKFYHANGPLYRILMSQREQAKREQTTIEQSLASLKKEHQQVIEALNQAEPGSKKPLGIQKGKLESEIEKCERKLEHLEQTLFEQEQEAQTQLEEQFRKLVMGKGLEPWSLADLLTLFWDDFFFWKDNDPYKRKSALTPLLKPDQGTNLPALLILSHGEVSGEEKALLLLDEDGNKVMVSPSSEELAFATAFGYDREKLDVWALHDRRFELIDVALKTCKHPIHQRGCFIAQARKILRLGLGDTQWPINEIDLWDYASSIAALFKSGVARAVLDEAIPTVDAMRWRFLSVRFDGLDYLSQAHHVTDLLGRRDSLDVALDAVRTLLEETYPLGNEVYRDENGAVFVVPGWEDARSTLALTDDAGRTLETLIAQAFREATRAKSDEKTSLPPFDGELEPRIEEGASVRGKELQLGAYLEGREQPLTADPARMAAWWQDEQAQDQEICTVCSLRPVGYRPQGVSFPGWVKTKNARDRYICCVCLHRRGRRAEQWLTQEEDTTIWADEVVDENGRFALLVGQFDLEHWLNGTLIPSMQKPASFARVQRVWGTTRTFWEEVEQRRLPKSLEKRTRMRIKPRNAKALISSLGNYHTYELDVNGRHLGVIWVPVKNKDGRTVDGHFLTTEYLTDLIQRLSISREKEDTSFTALQRWMKSHQGAAWAVYEPSGYAEPQAEKEANVQFESATGIDDAYVPHIPFLTEPTVFMALVPADKAMDVAAAIREKYEREMSKVQDRLPLHLGVVIAPRRTPLRAVLDAGRALLERPTRWEAWNVAAKPQHHGAPPADPHLKADAHFAQWWEVSLKQEAVDGRELTLRIADRMGDGETEDVWHAHFCTTDPGRVDKALDPQEDVTPVSDLAAGAKVYLYPATFDFEYLDTTARRFTLAYNQDNGRRLGRASRPYLLHHVANLAGDLAAARRSPEIHADLMWIHGLIEEKWHRWRADWQESRAALDADYTAAFGSFVKDTLRTAEWKQAPGVRLRAAGGPANASWRRKL